jgi:hypothetical protein
MEKNQKMWLIGGGIAALGLLTYVVLSKKNTSTLNNNTTTITPSGACPAGQVPCSNNRLKCYNPSANYTVDPCGTTSVATQNPLANPIAEIVDGIFGLFKKKTSTPVGATPPLVG